MKSTDRLLICSDLDGTLIPNGTEPESPGSHEHLTILASHPQVWLAYVSGRHSDLIGQAIVDNHLLVPDFVIGDVGTTIYHVDSENDWKYQVHWEENIGKGIAHYYPQAIEWMGFQHPKSSNYCF